MFMFGSGTLFGVQTQDAAGNATANATPVEFGTLQDVSGDISFETKELYGAYQFPVMVARGKAKMDFKAKAANINSLIIGDLLLGTGSTAGVKAVVSKFPASVPAASPYTLTMSPPSSGSFVADLGVLNASTGLPLKKVASAPTTGQYSVSSQGVYTFASTDANAAVLISYEYSATGTEKIIAIDNQLMGTAPMFKVALALTLNGKKLTLVLNSCTSKKLSLPFKSDDFTIPEFDFSAMADASGRVGYLALSE